MMRTLDKAIFFIAEDGRAISVSSSVSFLPLSSLSQHSPSCPSTYLQITQKDFSSAFN